MKKKLTIIIVTFESSAIIRSCLEKINFTKYDVFVVDNNSQDDTTKIVELGFPQVNLIKLSQNVGFGRANNMALRKADTDFALILNPDAFMLEEEIEKVLKILNNNPDIALASPKTLHEKHLLNPQIKPVEMNSYSPTELVIGGVMFMNMKVFKKIGFFDENIFMFSEDNEISQRSLDNGYKNVVINNANAFHCGAGSSKKSLRTTYRRFWHLGWSKSYWKSRRKNWISVKRSTLRLVILYLIESIFNIIKFNKDKAVSKFAFAMGCTASLFGLKAFKKNGKARG